MEQMTLLEQIEEFYYITFEDWQLWDEGEQGPYPVQRIHTAMKAFIDKVKESK
jgi:hypothetical protein